MGVACYWLGMDSEEQDFDARLKRVTLHYFDCVWGIERRLRMLAKLMQGCRDPEKIDPELLEEMGALILELIDARKACDHYFLKRDLEEAKFCPNILAQLTRLEKSYSEDLRN